MSHALGPIRSAVLSNAPLRRAWGRIKARQLEFEYENRRRYYAHMAAASGYRYDESATMAAVRGRLADRGWRVRTRDVSAMDVHTVTFVPLRSEHRQLLTDLHELGPVSNFDAVAHGFDVAEFRGGGERARDRRRELNELFVEFVRRVHSERAADWVYVYASGLEIAAPSVARIQREMGIPTVTLCMDDKHSWTGEWMGDHPAGQVGIAPVFDLSVTTSSIALSWYELEGGRAIHMPEGYDASVYHPMPLQKDIDISFLGRCYGARPDLVGFLRKHGVPVRTFGPGWPGSDWIESPAELFNRTRLNLGSGGIGYSERLTTVKGRDFDIPGTGGGAYITSYNADLARAYGIGEEILCYSSRSELLELIRRYLDDEPALARMAARAHARCLREHRWLHRYRAILRVLGVLP